MYFILISHGGQTRDPGPTCLVQELCLRGGLQALEVSSRPEAGDLYLEELAGVWGGFLVESEMLSALAPG